MMEVEKLWDHPGPHTLRKRVEAEDIDGLNHTNNAVYVKWCEQVAWSHSVALGLDLTAYRALDRAMAITYSEHNYLQASREGDDIIAGTWIVSWDRKLTMARRFQVLRLSDGAGCSHPLIATAAPTTSRPVSSTIDPIVLTTNHPERCSGRPR